jgi:hypothetical protein
MGQLRLAVGLLVLAGCHAPDPDTRVNGTTVNPRTAVEQMGGRVTVDEADPSRPVVGVDFRGNARVRDEDLDYLAGFPKLRMLDLRGTGVTDAGVARLASCAGLAEVDLRDTAVSDAGAERLARALPKLNIIR